MQAAADEKGGMGLRLQTAFWAMIGAGLMLGGCAPDPLGITAVGYGQHVDSFVGISAEELQRQWGPPDRVTTLSDGRKLWIYRKSVQRHSDASSSTDTTYFIPMKDPELSWTSTCDTRFVIGLDGKVQRVTFDGDACRYQEVRAKKTG